MITDILICVIGALLVLVACGLCFEKGRLAGIRQARRTDPERIFRNVGFEAEQTPMSGEMDASIPGTITGFILDTRKEALVICKKCAHPLPNCMCPERNSNCKHAWPCDPHQPESTGDPR